MRTCFLGQGGIRRPATDQSRTSSEQIELNSGIGFRLRLLIRAGAGGHWLLFLERPAEDAGIAEVDLKIAGLR